MWSVSMMRNGVNNVCELVINGGRSLCGEVELQGSKNSALPILAGTILTDEQCVIHNCPDISDTRTAIAILKDFGARAYRDGKSVYVCASEIDGGVIRRELMQKMRSSVMFTGALLSRCGKTMICLPGGCRLGERPIDLHISSLTSLGAKIEEVGECISCKLEKILSGDITLLYPSVGATENIMLMCANSGKEVRIFNPAREPEIVDLQNFLNGMGADIKGAGSDMIKISPIKALHGCEHSVIPDRIVASTYACAVAVCGGDVLIKGARADEMRLVLEVLKEIGCEILYDSEGVRVKSNKNLKPISMIKTLPYPGFPTDVQPLLGVVLSCARGTSKICETVFDSRFGYLSELCSMGARAKEYGSVAEFQGVKGLHGAGVCARDLRGGAALVVAALSARGTTVISGTEYIDRGYEKIEESLRTLGAEIYRI